MQDLLEERVILPLAGDLQVTRSQPDLFESCVIQHPLRREVVHKGARLQSVKAEIVPREAHGCAKNSGCQASAGQFRIDPISQARTLERAADDAGQRHPPDDIRVGGKHQGKGHPRRVLGEPGLDRVALCTHGEKISGTDGLPRRELGAVPPIGERELSLIAFFEEAEDEPVREGGGKLKGKRHPYTLAEAPDEREALLIDRQQAQVGSDHAQ